MMITTKTTTKQMQPTQPQKQAFRFERFFQVYSDLHIDAFDQNFKELLTPQTPFLLLAGDISKIDHPSFKEFFKYVGERWQHVFYVLGNHEFYHQTKSYSTLLKEYRSFFSQIKNIHLLEKESYYICVEDDDKGENNNTFKIQITGCTLWSCVPNDEAFSGIGSSTNILKKSSQNIDINYYNQHLNRSSVLWLLNEIDEIAAANPTNSSSAKPDVLIVLTHFPTMTSPKIFKPSFRDSGNGALFLANSNENIDQAIISSLFCSSPRPHVDAVYFVSGHTHYSFTFRSRGGKVTYISNQRGNSWEEGETRFVR